MANYNEPETKTRPNYGHLRVNGVNTELTPESVTFETAPRAVDIILDTSTYDGKIVTVGRPNNDLETPADIHGKIAHREVSRNGQAAFHTSLRGSTSEAMAALLTSYNNINPRLLGGGVHGDGLNGISGVSAGFAFSNMIAHIDAFPVHPDYHDAFTSDGENDTDFVGAHALLHSCSAFRIIGNGLDGQVTNRVVDAAVARMGAEDVNGAPITVHHTAVQGSKMPHIMSLGVDPVAGGYHGTLMHTARNAGGDIYNEYNPDLHGLLAQQATNTCDEWLIRNHRAIQNLVTRLPYFLKNEVTGSFQKGGRSQFASRVDDSTLKVMGQLMHLGMSLKLGEPVQNCYAFNMTADATTVQAQSGTDDTAGGTATVTQQSDTQHPNPQLAEAVEEMIASIDVEVSAPCHIVGYNAAVSPFFIYFFDGHKPGSTATEDRGIFLGLESLADQLSPGVVKPSSGQVLESRDPTVDDVLIGLDWVFKNAGEEMGAHWSSVAAPFMDIFEDIKSAKMVDVYANSSRLSIPAVRASWHLGENGTLDLTQGATPAGRTQNLVRFFSGSFFNKAALAQFEEEITDLGMRTFSAGGKFSMGQARQGDATSSTTYNYLSDGSIREVDVRLTPVSYGHWGYNRTIGALDSVMSEAIPANGTRDTWSSTLAALSGMTLDEWSCIPLDGVDTGTAVPTGSIVVDATNIFGIPAGTYNAGDAESLGILKTYLQLMTGIRGIGMAGDFNGPITWVGDRLSEKFTWDSYGVVGQTPTEFTNTGYRSLMLSPNGTTTAIMGPYPDEYATMEVGTTFFRWMGFFDNLFKIIRSTKNVEHYQAKVDLYTGVDINLVKELTMRTGDPAVQKFLDALVVACSQVYASGNPIPGAEIRNPYVVNRHVHNRAIHRLSQNRAGGEIDLLPMLLPSRLAEDFGMVTAVHRVMLDRLGLVGSGREGLAYPITGNNFRTIYDMEDATFFTGEVSDYGIDLSYNYETMTADQSALGWAQLMPHFAMLRRLFHNYGVTIGGMGLLGFSEDPTAAGSALVGLEGYVDQVPPTVVDVLTLTDLDSGQRIAGVQEFNFDMMENHLSNIKGSVANLHMNEADVSFLYVDQDLFDAEICRLAGIMNRTKGQIMVGPIPMLMKVSKSGDVSVNTNVSTGISVTRTSAPTETATAEEVQAASADAAEVVEGEDND